MSGFVHPTQGCGGPALEQPLTRGRAVGAELLGLPVLTLDTRVWLTKPWGLRLPVAIGPPRCDSAWSIAHPRGAGHSPSRGQHTGLPGSAILRSSGSVREASSTSFPALWATPTDCVLIGCFPAPPGRSRHTYMPVILWCRPCLIVPFFSSCCLPSIFGSRDEPPCKPWRGPRSDSAVFTLGLLCSEIRR